MCRKLFIPFTVISKYAILASDTSHTYAPTAHTTSVLNMILDNTYIFVETGLYGSWEVRPDYNRISTVRRMRWLCVLCVSAWTQRIHFVYYYDAYVVQITKQSGFKYYIRIEYKLWIVHALHRYVSNSEEKSSLIL